MTPARSAWQTFIVLLLLSVLFEGQTPKPVPSPPVEQSPAGDDASKEAVVFERNATKVVYEADGTGTRETTVVVRMVSDAGVKAFAVLAFPYTSYNDQVEIDYVRVRKPDGTLVSTPDYNIQDMPADVTRQAPMYSDIHEKHVTVKALGVGDVLEYLVRYRTIKPEVPGHFWYEDTFTKAYIVKDEEVEIAVPKDKYVKVASSDVQPAIKEDATHKIYSWKTSNLDLKERETLMKKTEAPKPSVQVTTFHTWEEVGSWYRDLQRSQVVVTPQIQAKVAELTKGLTTDDDKIHAIYKFVSTQIHYVSLSFGIGRYQPHPAEDVFENEYGDCKDKHTLLATMLQAAGIEAWPVLIHATQKLDPDVPSPGQFNHLISVLPRGKEFLWLDTTPEVAPAGLLLANLRDKQALVMPNTGPASVMTTPAQPPFPASITFSGEGKVSPEGTLTMHVQRTARGDAEVLYRAGFRSVSPAQWKQLAQQISNFSGFGGEVSEVTASAPEDTDTPFQFSYDYTRKNYSEWSDHRMIAPLPFFGIESAGSQDEKPVEPVILGAQGEVVFQSKIALPAGLAPPYSDEKDLMEDFADYHATYEIKNGVLKATRRLVVKQSKVPLASWDSYKKFCKAISDDFDRYLNLDTGKTEFPPGEGPAPQVEASSNPTVTALGGSQEIMEQARQANPEAAKLMDEGQGAMQGRDSTRAQEAFRKVISLNPKFPGAHVMLGIAYLTQGNREGALSELRKEEEFHPENPITYQVLARVLSEMRRQDEALAEYQKLLRIDPANRDAALAVAAGLNKQQKYSEAVQVLEKAVQQSPDSPALQLQLAEAYLHNKQSDKASPLLKKAAEGDSSANTLNSVAYELADNNVALDDAAIYGDKALRQAEADSVGAADDEAGLTDTLRLGEIWDTVGWIYFRKADYEKALPYIRAAWLLTQDPIVGSHLGQIYENLGKKTEAAHQYELALAASFDSNSENENDLRQHYKQLVGKEAEDHPRLQRSRPGAGEYYSPQDELSHMRTVRLSSAAHEKGSADFTVIFSPSKTAEVKYVSGTESLKAMGEQISRAKLQTEIPDSNPSRVFRSGILACGEAGCDFVFLLPDRVHVRSTSFPVR